MLSTAARVNNELVRARDAGDATALCKIIKAHHSAFNSVNFVTSWRALLQIRRGLRPHAGALAGAASAPVDGEPADSIDAGRAHKKRGSELESAARAALKQARYEAAADLAQQAAVAFEDAARSGVKLGWRMAKDSLGLYRRAHGLLHPSGASNSSEAMDARAPGAAHGSRVDVQLLDATTKVAAPLTRSARVSLSRMAATAKQCTLQHACMHARTRADGDMSSRRVFFLTRRIHGSCSKTGSCIRCAPFLRSSASFCSWPLPMLRAARKAAGTAAVLGGLVSFITGMEAWP